MGNSFGIFLKQKRQEKNLTQKDLAKMLFVSDSAVNKWEKNVSHPDITLLPKLAEILDVTEHELITASIDKKTRAEKVQAKRWRALSMSWSLFFYIAYAVALIPCFICNLAINRTLSWFWIVLSALILAFTFTNLPGLIKKHKLLLLPLSMFLALCLLLGVCCIYTGGNWFWIVVVSVLLGLTIIFFPIYLCKYSIFKKLKKYADFVSIFADFIILNILLVIINIYTHINNFSSTPWFLTLAFPITLCVYLVLNLFLCVRFINVNKLLKTSIIMFMLNIIYCFAVLVRKSKNPKVQFELESLNIFKANFSNWTDGISIERNIHLIIFLTILGLGVMFMIGGVIKHSKKANKNNKIKSN